VRICIPEAGGQAHHIRNLTQVPGVDRVIITDIDAWAHGNSVAELSPLAAAASTGAVVVLEVGTISR
jgi:S-adenosylmethionine:diacylglycerol 3-amino-3-carboxypropyl transferase